MCRRSMVSSSTVSRFSNYISDRLISKLSFHLTENGNGNEYMKRKSSCECTVSLVLIEKICTIHGANP